MIQELSEQEKCVNISDLAEKYEVSERTVRNDLNTINDILRKHKLDMVKLEKGGQIIRGDGFSDVLSYIQLFERQNIAETTVIGVIYLICIVVSVYYSGGKRHNFNHSIFLHKNEKDF